MLPAPKFGLKSLPVSQYTNFDTAEFLANYSDAQLRFLNNLQLHYGRVWDSMLDA